MIQQLPSRVFFQVKTNAHTKACTWMFIVALIPPNWKQPRYPLKEKQLNWPYHTYVIEYYSAIKWTNYQYTQPGWNSRDLCQVNTTVSEVYTLCCVVLSRSVVSELSVTPWTIAHQLPLSMGILQARILEWVAVPSSRRSSQPRDRSQVSLIADAFFTVWATREAHTVWLHYMTFPTYILIERGNIDRNGCHGLRRWLWRCGVRGWECVWLSKTAGGIPVVMKIFWILTASISISWLWYHTIAL